MKIKNHELISSEVQIHEDYSAQKVNGEALIFSSFFRYGKKIPYVVTHDVCPSVCHAVCPSVYPYVRHL